MTAKATIENPEKRMAKLLESLRYRYGMYDLFRDFCELSACAISNAVDSRMYEAREAQYMRVAGKYTAEEMPVFCQALGCLIEALDACGPEDVLGRLFTDLEITNKDAGQFFTPQSISELIGNMLCDKKDLRAAIEQKGYITVHEPAVGGGVLIPENYRALPSAGECSASWESAERGDGRPETRERARRHLGVGRRTPGIGRGGSVGASRDAGASPERLSGRIGHGGDAVMIWQGGLTGATPERLGSDE